MIDIFSAREDAREWIAKCYLAFKKRYPTSTRIFWLIDWAVQGVIPETANNGNDPGSKYREQGYTAA